MKKVNLYKIIKPIVIVFTKLFLHPKYEGLENIPKEKRIVLAGNHIHPYDCLVLMCSTKRNIHFLAKDELWKGPKKIIFSNLELIPVNRREKDKYALKKAEEYLQDEEVIGIFPEGTTEKGRGLLPFKMGAVKMAKDTDTKIIPFAITGSYKPFKKIHITFGDTITIKSDNLEHENNKLRRIVEKMIKER